MHYIRGFARTADGTKIVNATGEVVAERVPTIARREALDRLSAYAVRKLKMHPDRYFKGDLDAAMRAAFEQARRDLPDLARAAA